MKVNITARHLELTSSLKEYAEKKLLQVKKYAKKITAAHIILNVEKNRHITEVKLSVSGGSINAKAQAGDMYGAIDIVMDKVVGQLRRHTERIKDHKDLPYSVVVRDTINSVPYDKIYIPGKNSSSVEPEVEEVKEFKIKTQSVSSALKMLDKSEKKLTFWVFRNEKDSKICIIYRRKDATHGILIIKGTVESEQ